MDKKCPGCRNDINTFGFRGGKLFYCGCGRIYRLTNQFNLREVSAWEVDLEGVTSRGVFIERNRWKKNIIVFASGSKDGGGSGFKELIENIKTGILQGKIVAVVSNHKNGGVRKTADFHGIPFIHFDGPFTSEEYQKILNQFHFNYIILSGWLFPISGHDPRITINIHPGPLVYGGKGMYGHHVHEAILADFKEGKIKESAVSMHFVTEEYDRGPVFFHYPVAIRSDDTAETLAQRVNKIEHGWQSYITNLYHFDNQDTFYPKRSPLF